MAENGSAPWLPDESSVALAGLWLDLKSRNSLSLPQRLINAFLVLIPGRLKRSMYSACARMSTYFGGQVTWNVFRLPFGLVLKFVHRPSDIEGDALRFLRTVRGIHTPHLLDSVPTLKGNYLLTTWMEGQCMSDVWYDLSRGDKERIVEDLRQQFSSMRLQTRSTGHYIICSASGGPIDDPRVPWVAQENPRTFTRCQDFAEEVWPGDREELRPILKPLIKRDNVPIVFSHGDLVPKNLILPKNLGRWRSGRDRIRIIDWEYAGWMPTYWDPLKATWLQCEQSTEWLEMARRIFPECNLELDADWEWRSRSRITIL